MFFNNEFYCLVITHSISVKMIRNHKYRMILHIAQETVLIIVKVFNLATTKNFNYFIKIIK